ncbi:hypothetical protein CLV92_10281 [Kineococcus xinjiangensis]|uniref:Prepilin-type N-terminal cleavage/methylation domain-containing protein n=1 Tax=Kineococcus xinjiangensis TaxID=512762 RepID=A0A2S6IUJ0_9ACTN|nr:hypothetical protein [Kineococcus xinjiangensis]PPK97931.1 hypothetical protein CLV92_10281 [Kineococcus xinjiangensis]
MIRQQRPSPDEGLSLVDLTVAAAVLGVLAAAAVPVHAAVVRQAQATAAASDARHAALLSRIAALETGSFRDADLTDEAAIAALPGELAAFRRSPRVRTRVWGIPEAAAGTAPAGSCALAHHDQAGLFAMHDSSHGAVAAGFTATDVPRLVASLPASAPCRRLSGRWHAAVTGTG